MFGDVMGIDGHDDAAQSIGGEGPHVLLRPKRAIAANHWMDASLRGVTRHRPEVLVHEGLTADEKQVTDVVFDGNVYDIPRLLQGNAAALFGVEPVDGEATKIALGIANVGYGELEISRPPMIQHIPEEPGPATWRYVDFRRLFGCPNGGRLGQFGRR